MRPAIEKLKAHATAPGLQKAAEDVGKLMGTLSPDDWQLAAASQASGMCIAYRRVASLEADPNYQKIWMALASSYGYVAGLITDTPEPEDVLAELARLISKKEQAALKVAKTMVTGQTTARPTRMFESATANA